MQSGPIFPHQTQAAAHGLPYFTEFLMKIIQKYFAEMQNLNR